MTRAFATTLAIALALFALGAGCESQTAAKPTAAFALPAAGASTDTALRIGDAFPPLTGTDLDGNPLVVGPEHYGERATLIVFWSTWCGFCMLELPHEIELAQLYADSGLRVIGVNADETREVAHAAVEENGIPWLNVYEGPERTISNELQIAMWPTLYLLDAKGRIVGATPFLRMVGAEIHEDGVTRQVNALDWTLDQLLGKPAQ
jgi:thiol-disulfide isomerase/thioredoxin